MELQCWKNNVNDVETSTDKESARCNQGKNGITNTPSKTGGNPKIAGKNLVLMKKTSSINAEAVAENVNEPVQLQSEVDACVGSDDKNLTGGSEGSLINGSNGDGNGEGHNVVVVGEDSVHDVDTPESFNVAEDPDYNDFEEEY